MSNIDLTNIDKTFPIAGQDNDSQGFRDNFFNTVDNFEIAKTEIAALENITTLKTPPATPVGAAGDLAGSVAIDDVNGFLYVCFADYTTGAAAIWTQSAATKTW